MKKYKLIKVNLETLDTLTLRRFNNYKKAFNLAVKLNRIAYLDKYLFKII